jgi:DNA-binding NtrC family response regulator
VANDAPTQQTQATLRRSDELQVPGWALEVVDTGGKARLIDLSCGQTLRVGQHPKSDLVLKDALVSRAHAELRAEPQGLRVVDLSSTNGTFVQGVRVVEALLEGPATVTLGNSSLRVQPGEAVPAPPQFGELVGRGAAMRGLFRALQRVARNDSTVLLQGESGCGKELAARSLHHAGERGAGPYVVFDCASVTPSLVESALFGHEKGAFTGATATRHGCFEEASGGTLFIDEVGELPLELQPRLLRALESRTVQRVGGNTPIPFDVRVVAATHRNLGLEVNRGAFREDLYYRLAVVQLTLPPLRERTEDLPLLVEHLLSVCLKGDAKQTATALARLDAPAWARLQQHPWRGNVRELRNAVERALALGEPVQPFEGPVAQAPGIDLSGLFLEQKQAVLDTFERTYLTAMLERHQGNFSRAAASAGIDRMYFKRLLKKHGLA